MKRLAPFILIVILGLASFACAAVSRAIFGEAPTPLAANVTLTLLPPPISTLAPSPTPDFCPNGDCITACLDKLDDLTRPNNAEGETRLARKYFLSDDEYTLVTYTIDGDQIKNPVDEAGLPKNYEDYQQDRAAQQQIWNYFAAIIPSENRKFLSEYVVFTDGKENILAAVWQSDHSPDEWVLSVDIMDASNPQDLTFTLVHEYGHLLTLNPAQVPPSRKIFDNPDSEIIYEQEVNACSVYFPGEGCPRPDSYLNQFVDRFWDGIYDEWLEIDLITDEDDYYDALDTFYKNYTDQFVSDYAPTSPAEDIAETFGFFILQPRPVGTSLADQKILFFYDFPELVQLRAQMGHRLCDQIKK
jgi:hypothetical protein